MLDCSLVSASLRGAGGAASKENPAGMSHGIEVSFDLINIVNIAHDIHVVFQVMSPHLGTVVISSIVSRYLIA